MKKFIFSLLILVGLVLAGCSSGSDDAPDASGDGDIDFPDRQIRYIVPYKTGGSSDVTARSIEKIIRDNDLLPEPFSTTNIDGASAGNGMVEVRDAEADGHTLLHHDTSFIAHEVTGVRDWGFRDYKPVAKLFEIPGVIVTHSDKYEDLDEWIDDVKDNPGDTTFAVSSVGGSTYLYGEQILEDLDLKDDVNVVAYGSGSDLNASIAAGEDNVAAGQLTTHLPHHLSGDQRILAVGTPERLDSIPDVPTFDELGIEVALPVTHRMGVWAPKDTPDAVVDELYDLFEEVITSEEFEEEAVDLGIRPSFADGDELFKTFEEDEKILADLVEKLGLEIE